MKLINIVFVIGMLFVSGTSLACIGTTGPTGEEGTDWDVPCQDPDDNDPGAGTAPNNPEPPPPPPPPLPPIDDPTPPNDPEQSDPEPSDPEPDEPTPRQLCLQSNLKAKQNLAECRAYASSRHVTDLKEICLGGGTIQFGASLEAGTLVVTGGSFSSITVDEYTQCKDLRDSNRNQAYDSCDVISARATKVCPGD